MSHIPALSAAPTGRAKTPDAPLKDSKEKSFFGKDGFSFGDILDIINPLQHIPVISTIYRNLTGDEINPGARVAGGAAWGGPIGFVASVVNSAIESISGKDAGEHVLALFTPEEPAPVQTASISSPIPAAAPAKGVPAHLPETLSTPTRVDLSTVLDALQQKEGTEGLHTGEALRQYRLMAQQAYTDAAIALQSNITIV